MTSMTTKTTTTVTADGTNCSTFNLVLGHSTRMARNEIARNKDCTIGCIVSPSPRAARRMDDEGLIETFREVGTVLKKMKRLEVHFYSTGSVWLPTKALTILLSNAPQLDFLLLNGMRLKGSMEEVVELANVFKRHPSLDRCSLFNINSLNPTLVPLHPLLEGVRANPNLRDVALRYAAWASVAVDRMVDNDSMLRIFRISGKQTVTTDRASVLPKVMTALKTNTVCNEITIHQSVAPTGSGEVVADMLRENKHLEAITMELGQFDEAIPIAQALGSGNSTLKRLDLKFHNTDPSKARPQIWTDLYGSTARATSSGRFRRMNWESDDSDSDEDEEVKIRRLNRTIAAFEECLQTNTTLAEIKLITPGGQRHESYSIMLQCRLNAKGCRQRLLMSGDNNFSAGVVLYYLDMIQKGVLEEENTPQGMGKTNNSEGPVEPIDVAYTLLRSKPSLISWTASEITKAALESNTKSVAVFQPPMSEFEEFKKLKESQAPRPRKRTAREQAKMEACIRAALRKRRRQREHDGNAGARRRGANAAAGAGN